MSFSSWFRLFRIDHAVMLSFSVFASIVISFQGFPSIDPFLVSVLLVPFLVEMGAFSLNDILDVDSDRKNRRFDRPIVSGELSREDAFRASLFSFLLSSLLTLFLPDSARIIVFIFIFLSILYDFYLKHLPLIGNMYIAFSMAVPFVYGPLSYGNLPDHLNLLLFSSAFFSGICREIIKDIQDAEGDMEAGSKTLPIILGKKRAYALSFVFGLVGSASLSLIGVLLSGSAVPVFASLSIAFAYLLAKCRCLSMRSLELFRKYSLVLMFFGVLLSAVYVLF